MKVETSNVTKLYITGADRLDPITVFLEDFEPRKGKITVSCWGKSWTAFWGGMWDGHTVGSFFCQLDAGYIIGYFDQQMSATKFSGEELMKKVRGVVLNDRRRGHLDAEDARELYDEAEELEAATSLDYLWGGHSDLMNKVFGDEWWYEADRASEPNPDYQYLERIIAAVQQALQQSPPALAA
ncbi:hypothetical protein E8F20_06000 [Pseudomonas sp. BN415]|nr:hypothetical protein [Pseudomonas sp. BN415]